MSLDFSHVTFISAGAGSGKTYRLTEELERALVGGEVEPSGVLGTTFTVKAASELQERVRRRLVEQGVAGLARQMDQALLGTVHSVCERLLRRFAFELGLSPELRILTQEDGQRLFNQALDESLSIDLVRTMNELARALSQSVWQSAVKRIADKVRENDIAPGLVADLGRRNRADFLGYCPPVDTTVSNELLLQRIKEALSQIDVSLDPTVTTRKFVAKLSDAQRALTSQFTWSDWMGLVNAKAAKASDGDAARVREVAASFAAHPDFQQNVGEYIEQLFTIAGKTLERFQALKAERGLIDFLDMEQLMLRALERPDVCARLQDSLQLLLVDEFQDTNPLQLALFIKLSQLADRAIFVGDVKQAIFAFRGSDPELVFATLTELSAAQAVTDQLPNNWRSRPQLVAYCNELFGRAFGSDPGDLGVGLVAQRTEVCETPAVVRWSLADANKQDRAAAIAAGVAQLVADGYEVVDPASGLPRPVRWQDIAVLARTNDQLQSIAEALKLLGVPVKMTVEGLLTTPEAVLARACLRRLADPTDTIATAEIVCLSESSTPESWLADRMDYLASEQPAGQWLEHTHPIVSRLAELRDEATLRSPVEIVARTLNDVGLRRIAASWGPDGLKALQRQRNLDALVELAVQYENYAALQNRSATLTGFLFWLDNPVSPELDLQPVVTAGDAVHVVTYHRSKGLEWPVVVASDLEQVSRSRLWDVRTLAEGFDVLAPLHNRFVRAWPNIFGRRSRGIELLERIVASDEGQACVQSDQAEARRLAYVGFTRARDLLVLGVPNKMPSDAWLSSFATEESLPNGTTMPLGGSIIRTAMDEFAATTEVWVEERSYQPKWFADRQRVEHPAKFLPPSSEDAATNAGIETAITLGERIPLRGEDMTALGNALHAVIAFCVVNPEHPQRDEVAAAILQGYGVEAYIQAERAVRAAETLVAYVTDHWQPLAILAEQPMVHVRDNGQVSRGFIDLLVQTAAGWHVVDHKSSPRPRSEWQEEALSYSGQLAAYGEAVAAATDAAVRLHVHFTISAGLIELRLER